MKKRNLLTLLFVMCSLFSFAQKFSVSGKITDSNGKSLNGISVYFRGTTIGTSSDKNGIYNLKNIKPGYYDLVVSCAGFMRNVNNIIISDSDLVLNFSLKESNQKLGEVVITGTGTRHHLKSAPVETILISKQMISQTAAPDFATLMSSISPSFDFSPGLMGSFMSLNGLGNNYILVMVDGKRLYGGLSGQNDLNRINLSNIERIEIVKGASSSLYGSEAIAGVVNIITKNSKKKIQIENNTRISEYGQWEQLNSLDLKIGRLKSSTVYAHKESDGWQLNPMKIDKVKDKNDPSDDVLKKTDGMAVNAFEDVSLSQKFEFNVSNKLSVYANGSAYEKDIYMPITYRKYGYHYEDLNYSLGGKLHLNKTDVLTLDFNSDNYKYYYIYTQDHKKSKAGDKVLNKSQTREDLNLKYIASMGASHKLSLGAEYVKEKLESQSRLVDPRVDAYTVSAFAQDEYKVNKQFSIVTGLRFVDHKEFGTAFSPKISGLYKVKDFNFRATYSKGFKAPTLKELYYRYEMRGKLYLGNKDLKAQTSNYFSFTTEYNANAIHLSASVYRNELNDMIGYRTIETSAEDTANKIKKTRQKYNIAEARTQGIDLIMDFKLNSGFSIGGGYSYVDAKDQTNDSRLPSVAYNHANIRLFYNHSWSKYIFNASLIGRIQDEKFYEDVNAEGYNIWKLTTTHTFAQVGDFDFVATAGIDNILDEVDDRPLGVHYGTINPGRTFFIGLNIKFSK